MKENKAAKTITKKNYINNDNNNKNNNNNNNNNNINILYVNILLYL